MISDNSRVLVLSNSGMIGSALRYELPRAGLTVEAPSRKQFDVTRDPVTDLPIHDFDYVINCIKNPPKKPDTHLQINSLFPHLLAQQCALHKSKLIHVSPQSVYNGKLGLYTEKSIPDALDKQGRSMLLGEPDRALILRASILGPEQNNFHHFLCRLLQHQDQISGYMDQRWTYITSLQFARVIAQIINKKMFLHGIRHIPGATHTHLELVDMIARIYNRQIPITAKKSPAATDYRLSTIHQNFLKQLHIAPTLNQLQEIKNISDEAGRWHQVFVKIQDLDQADQLHKTGNILEAEQYYRSILETSPKYMPALVNLGVILNDQGRSEEAINCYAKALNHDPQNAVIHNNIGNSLKILGRSKEAAIALERAVAINPQYEKALSNLGDALFDVHRFDESRLALEKALVLNSTNALTWNRLGRVHSRQCRVKEAIKCFRKSFELSPEMQGAHSNILFTMHFLPDFTPDEIAAAHRDWDKLHAQLPTDELFTHEPRDADKDVLRIGLVSDCFKRHPVGDFLHALFRERDKTNLEFVCYSDVINNQPMTKWFHDHSEEWHDISRFNDLQLARLVKEDEIDILIDLAGHTGQSRLLAFARKPAPIQATWMGYIDTTGMQSMDYIIADHICIPEGEDHLYSEKIMRLSDDFLCYTAPDFSPKVSPLPATKNKYITFGSFNQLVKSTVEVVQVWAEVMKRTPDSRMLLVGRGFDDLSMRERFIERFAMAGITEDRLELLGGTTHLGLMERYSLMDIALDTFPYVGGTTTCEALWMGVPVVTFTGERFCSRHSASHLTNAGLTELVGNNIDDYITIASDLANDFDRLKNYRKTLRKQCSASPLCDAKKFAAEFSKAMRQMWQESIGQKKAE